MHNNPLDVLVEELAVVAGRVEREAALRLTTIVADLRRIDAERELRIVALEQRVSDRLALIKDGAPGRDADPDDIAQMVRAAVARAVAEIPRAKDGQSVSIEEVRPLLESLVAALPPPEAGRDADPDVTRQLVADEVSRAIAVLPPPAAGKDADPVEVARLVSAEVKRVIADLPKPADGKDADPADIQRLVDEAVARLPKPKDGADGKLPAVQEWKDAVHYEGSVVTLDGSTYQAKRDTGRTPPHEDWACIARAGRDGLDGRSPKVRNTYSDEVGDYRELDIVALNGAAFIARRDEPGPCPGDGWQVISIQGRRGKEGEKVRGERGPPGPKIEQMSVDNDGLLILTNSDGSVVTCDLYPLLSRLQR